MSETENNLTPDQAASNGEDLNNALSAGETVVA